MTDPITRLNAALPPDRQQEFIAAHASKREELSKAH